jgi:spore maturation protein CgeB
MRQLTICTSVANFLSKDCVTILVIGKFYTEAFALHIAETLEAMGHRVLRFEAGVQSDRLGRLMGHRLRQLREVIYSSTDNLPSIRASRTKRLWRFIDGQSIDLVIVCYDFLWPAEVAELKRRTKAQVAMWFPDSCINFGRGFFMNAAYDGIFFKDPYNVAAMSGVLKAPVYYLPECFNPARHTVSEDTSGGVPAYGCDLTTAGNQHSYRVAFFKNLADYDVKIWGLPAPTWMDSGPVAAMYQKRAVYNKEKALAFRGARIVVNNLSYGEIWGVNVRCFEAAGTGAFQVVDWRPGLPQLFTDGQELISFRGISDLKQKVDYWLPREQERRAIAESGRRRAHAEHTYSLRLELLMRTLMGNESGYEIPSIQYVQ